MLKFAKALVKSALDKRGTATYNKASFGHDALHDIEKIATSYGLDVKTILDVGAHFGGSAENFRDRFPAATIHCFEPNPTSFEKLKLRFSADQNIKPHQIALSNEHGTLPFYVYENACINSLVPNAPFAESYNEVADTIDVEVNTTDSFLALQGISHVNFMKIDTEGREPEVLLGAIEALKKHAIDFLYLEFNSIFSEEKSSPLVKIASILEPLGYRFIATYNDYCTFDDQHFNVSNVLYFRKIT